MKLRFTIAGLCVFALMALPLRAQHGGGHSGGGHSGGGGSSWHGGSGGSGGGHYSGGGEVSHGYAGGSYGGGAAMYPPSARGQASGRTEQSGRPAASYSSHDPASQFGWQALYSSGPEVHFSASMLPPNARGYSAAPRESVNATVPTRAGTEPLRVQEQWTSRTEFNQSGRLHNHFYGRVGRAYGGFACGPFLGFGFCGGPFFYGFYGASFGCVGGSYWDASNWAAAPALLNLSPCLALGYEPDENQISPDASPYDSDDGPAPDADASAQGDAGSDETSPAPTVADQRPETLLQLKDGSMYGLTQYWVAGGLLNYVTDYGARNAVPFDRIDIAKTVQLNSQRGVPFVLQTNSAAH